ncbi:TonB-dependent receptor [Sphingomonas sanguinis]|uniref:TonB-dependent receptor n=1 Tax=Sphingomonas sanguinis TaxID=33051 RepID=A0ABU5LRM5_9SPHN|nr:TonB-dependent receptor [Sphingomonas sanguinis]MDZ7282579.1 TonB-dependent receptor [Sphingomonas sanguinis]
MNSTIGRATMAVLLAGLSQAAFIQSAAAQAMIQPQDDAAENADVIVTAQKREQRITDVPVTVTAVTGARMADLGVNSLSEVAQYIPGLQIQEQSPNSPGFVIRGITSDSGSAQQGARVTVYYNGVDISRKQGAYQDLYDIERIEVVKGPQATLFGTAAAVGAINIVSAKPRAGTEGGILASYGNFDRTQVSGYLNAGNDTLAGRIAFAYKYRDGYVRNIAGDPNVPNQNQGRVDQDDLNGQDQRGVRGSLRWTPNSSLTADLVLTYDGQRNPGTAFKSRVFAPTGGQTGDYGYAELSGSPFSAEVLGRRKLGLTRNVYDANLTVAVDVAPGITFTTVNGYRRFDALEIFDADGGPAWYLEFAEDAKGEQWSHEGRFSFDGAHYRASFGWNAFFENGQQRVPFSTEEGTYLACSVARDFAPIRQLLNSAGVPTGTACVAPNGTIPGARATAILSRGTATVVPYSASFANYGNTDTYSVFADATWIPVTALELTAGARILIEDRQSGYSSVMPDSRLLAGAGIFTSLLAAANTKGQEFTAERSYAAILPRFNALYRLSDDVNVYATISKGRRSPVVQLDAQRIVPLSVANSGAIPRLQIIPAENVWNYEGGIKGRVGPFSGAASVFYQRYKGFQVTVFENGLTVTRSAGSANNLGVELEGNVALHRWLSLFGTFAYIDGGIGNAPSNGVFAGNRFRLQPDTSASGGANVRIPIGSSATFYATPSATYRSKVYFELPNSEAISQGGYTLVNLRAGVEFGDHGRFHVGAFARNLTNKRYLIDAGNTGGTFDAPTYIAGEPRFYGVELGARF